MPVYRCRPAQSIKKGQRKTLNRRFWSIAGLALILSFIALPSAYAQGDKPTVRGYLFYADDCPTCLQVRTGILQELYKEFGQQLQIKAIDIDSEPANQQWFRDCAETYAISSAQADIPALFIGDKALIGAAEIESQLLSIVQAHMESGGIDFPDVPRPGGPLEPTVRFMFFQSPTCPHCTEVKENVLPRLRAKYGDRVQWESYDRSEEINYRALLILGELTGLPQEARGAVPLIFIGDEYTIYARFLGGIEIDTFLEDSIDWYMKIGGVDWPDWKDRLFVLAATPFPQQTPAAVATSTPASAIEATETPDEPSVSPPIHMAYFEEAGCSECDAVSAALEHVQNSYPNLVVHKLDIIDDLATNLCLSERLNVPENQRHDAPAVFVGSDYLVAKNVHYESLMQLVGQYVESGAEPTWENCQEEQVKLPPPPPWWAVILPGLGDGINPCAFATIIFFVSYLSLADRKGRDIILVGVAFALAVFVSYLAFGIVLREILSGLIGWTGPVLRPILNGLTAVLCLVLAIVSFGDFEKARQGNAKGMTLRLPDRLRKWINATIRRSMKASTFIIAAFAAGVVVSFIELACTGQVYVPIILGLSAPGYRSQALVALIVYCLAFIVPLIVVFVVSYMGTSSRTLGVLLNRHTATIKLITAVLFLAIGLWLIYDTLHTWGFLTPVLARASM
jgi:cytochrome c biogenesis protein CcdA/thiol-disulfide isomerase/thioredoxin